MDNPTVDIDKLVSRPDLDPEEQGAMFWYQAYLEQRQRLEPTLEDSRNASKRI